MRHYLLAAAFLFGFTLNGTVSRIIAGNTDHIIWPASIAVVTLAVLIAAECRLWTRRPDHTKYN